MDREQSSQNKPQKRPIVAPHPKPSNVAAEVIHMNDEDFASAFNTQRGPRRGRGRGQNRPNMSSCKYDS